MCIYMYTLICIYMCIALKFDRDVTKFLCTLSHVCCWGFAEMRANS